MFPCLCAQGSSIAEYSLVAVKRDTCVLVCLYALRGFTRPSYISGGGGGGSMARPWSFSRRVGFRAWVYIGFIGFRVKGLGVSLLEKLVMGELRISGRGCHQVTVGCFYGTPRGVGLRSQKRFHAQRKKL